MARVDKEVFRFCAENQMRDIDKRSLWGCWNCEGLIVLAKGRREKTISNAEVFLSPPHKVCTKSKGVPPHHTLSLAMN